MKRKILMLTALLISAVSTFADDMFTVTTAGIPKGAKGTIAIGLPAGNTNTYAAFQITLTLPTGLTYVSASADKGDLLTAAHNINASGETTVKITSAADPTTNFTGTSGTLCVLTVEATSDAATGNLTIKSGLENTVLTDDVNDTQNELASDEPHEVTVIDGVVLDENSTALPAEQGPVNVTVKRTLKAGVWNTICLPFSMTKDQALAVFGSGAKFCYLKSTETEGNKITVNFVEDDLTETGFLVNSPYIVKPTVSITSFTVSGVTVEPSESAAITAVPDRGSNKSGKFIGTLRDGTTIPKDYIFLGTDNKFYYSDGSTTIKGFRGYFWLKDFKSSTSAGSRQLKLVVDGEETTAIEGLYINGEPATVEGVYNLKGQRVDTPTQKGVYIKDGKKVVIK